jgi:CRISPR-associated protein Cmr2
VRHLEALNRPEEAARYRRVLEPVRELTRWAREAKIPPPQTRFAVLALDADHMGRLLLGDPNRIGARWADVLHPKVVEQMPGRPPLVKAGWLDLLAQKRLIGPGLHAFISRALADFAHVVVPWVVECEFGGRLIYSGGDDVLALTPAADALAIAARLQQLFSAAWVVDTMATADPWAWRRRDWPGEFSPLETRQRFQIPLRRDAPVDLSQPTGYEPHVANDEQAEIQAEHAGRVLGMLGHQSSLSAAIVYAHFKTPLGPLVEHARRLLEQTAKDKMGRSAVALAHYSRNGPKSEIALKWRADGEPSNGASPDARRITAHRQVQEVVAAFRSGELSGRLPYKLREVAYLADASRAAVGPTGSSDELPLPDRQLLDGLLGQAAGRRLNQELAACVIDLWAAGFRLHPDDPERSVDGLLLCRSLRNHTGEED